MTPSRSGTRSRPKHQRRPPAARRYPQTANSRSAMKVTFCVRGVLSPLLANLYMRRLVLGWKKLGLEQSLGTRLVTYADDLVILCRRGSAEKALHHLREIMSKLKLTVNEEKTRICRVPDGEFDFLGYTFGRMYSPETGKARLGYRPSKKSIKRMVERVHALTDRAGTAADHKAGGSVEPGAPRMGQ